MITSDIVTWIMDRLKYEAGTNKWWTNDQILDLINDVYVDTVLTFECLKYRDADTLTVVGTGRYLIPKQSYMDTIIRLDNVAYDQNSNGFIDFYTIQQLDDIDPLWRSLGNGTPWGAYFEPGDENLAVSLVPAPGAEANLSFEFRWLPSPLDVTDSPKEPFTNGVLLKDGTMSLALGLPGGGRDMDRADFYFGMFMSNTPSLTRHRAPVWRGFRSVEEAGLVTGAVRLPSNYPRYSFD